VNPALEKGDLLIFTEALVHGTVNWRSAAPRRTLLYKYSPGYSCWMPDEQLAPLRALASSELQHQLLRAPSVGAPAAEEAGGPLREALTRKMQYPWQNGLQIEWPLQQRLLYIYSPTCRPIKS
jgi:ectoine hydroxylase-related dioxygenase (phytanoyl-CoA dioxygenase family)